VRGDQSNHGVLQPLNLRESAVQTVKSVLPKLAIAAILIVGLGGLFILDKWSKDYRPLRIRARSLRETTSRARGGTCAAELAA